MDLRLRVLDWCMLPSAIAGILLSTPVLANPNGGGVRVQIAKDVASQLVFNHSASKDASSGFNALGRPRSRSSGGARGTCADRLVALLPGIEALAESGDNCSLQSASTLALTLDESPTFWFHIPERNQANRVAEFVLLDENQLAISIEQLTLPSTSGVVEVQLSQPLAVNQPYQWVFSILENQRNPSQNPAVEGVIQRVEPDANLAIALQNTVTHRERIAAFAQNGIWHDALTELATLRRSEPNNPAIAQDWRSFLSSVGLAIIDEAPLLNCCSHPIP